MHKRSVSQFSNNSQKSDVSSFMSANQLEQSMSYIERTAKKIYPILKELKKRLIPDKPKH